MVPYPKYRLCLLGIARAASSGMNRAMSNVEIVIEVVQRVLHDRGLPAVALAPDTNLLGDAGLDSLVLAEVVIRLEERTGKDPFRDGFIAFQTVKELAD